MLDRRQTLAGAGAAALALAPTLAHAAPAGTQSEQADAYLAKGSTDKPEKQSIDCVLITKVNAEKLNNFTLAK